MNGAPVPVVTFNPPVWENTIALPDQGSCWNLQAGPIFNNNDAQQKCQQTCGVGGTSWDGNWVTTIPGQMFVCHCCSGSNSVGYTRIRQQPIDFTGEFVLHCHILGHEDRGMMQNVQVVCPQGGVFGTPVPGQSDNCSQTTPAAPQCPASYQTSPQCASGSGS